MKKLLLALLATSAVAITGCANRSASPYAVNSSAQIAALTSQFEAACGTGGGTFSKGKAQGSEGLCTHGAKTADLYVNKDFVVFVSERGAEAYTPAQYAVLTNCGKDKGNYDAPMRFQGSSMVPATPDGKVTCKAKDWMSTVASPILPGGKRKTVVTGSARRVPGGQPLEGTIAPENLSTALRYALL